MKPVTLLVSLAGAILTAGGAQAQALYNQPGAAPGYGGGFLELLLTGRDPGAAPQRQYGRPGAGYGAAYARPEAADPFEEPSRPGRMAALPSGPETSITYAEPSPEYRRQTVAYTGGEAPGTIVIDTPSKFLYLVGGDGQALRYGIGVGRPGFTWSGLKTITAKREWPDWTPPAEMLKRRPDLPRHMAGGPSNPLGARAMYLGSTLYRIHGTNEPYTIGQNVSSGCIRMMNEDVQDLYERVRVGTRVKVI